MTILRKILWGTTIFTYLVFAITAIGMIFEPYGHSVFGGVFSVCCLYDLFSFIIIGFNIVGCIRCIKMSVYDRVPDVSLLLMNIAIIPVPLWFWWVALND